MFPAEGEKGPESLSLFHIFFTPFLISVRVVQILVGAHKPCPSGLCILEAGMTFCRWWRGAALGQTGWGRGCHCKQSSAYSWNEMTLWQWRLLCFWSSPVSLNCKSAGEHLFGESPSPSVLVPPTPQIAKKMKRQKPALPTYTSGNRICHQHFHTLIGALKGKSKHWFDDSLNFSTQCISW